MHNTEILRRLLASLAYRTRHAVNEAPVGFDEFEAGMDMRTPLDILNHINAILAWTRDLYLENKPKPSEELSWMEAVEKFHQRLRQLDKVLVESAVPDDETVLKIVHGPLSDALTHVGQLLVLRRLFGSPVPTANYFRAEIENGKLDRDQPVPV
jgi:hypothetical protein